MTVPHATTVAAFDAGTQFAQLLERVAAGEEITITQHGHPIARLVPAVPTPSIESRREAILKMRELAGRNRLGGVSIRDLIAEGRK
jgi:prevent-host-death family protein